MTEDSCSKLKVGFLLEPLGWTAPYILTALRLNPQLLRHVAEMSPSRMHLIGLALSHCDLADTSFVETAIAAPSGEVLQLALGWQPIGLKATMADLDHRILKRSSYCALVDLLRDHRMAKLLSFAGHIPERSLQVLRDLPPTLRPVALELRPHLYPGLTEGLELLGQRAGYKSHEDFVAVLATARHQGQLKAELCRVIEDLPLPETIPPERIGYAVRIDRSRKLRALANDMKNCIADLIPDIEQGHTSIYLWGDGEPIAILLQRHGRLGWFLDDVKGRRNEELPASKRRTIEQSFNEAGIPRATLAHALEEILELQSRARSFDGQRPFEDIDDWRIARAMS